MAYRAIVGQDIQKGMIFKIDRKTGQIVKYRPSIDNGPVDGMVMRDLKRGEIVYFGPDPPVLEDAAEDTCKPIIVEGP